MWLKKIPPSPLLLYFSLAKDRKSRQVAYRELFKERLSQMEIDTIREVTNKTWVLGSERFKQKVEKLSGRRATPKPKGRPKKNETSVS